MVLKLGTFKDKDNSLKCVFQNKDKNIIEMTLLSNKENIDVVCAPSHHFCNLGCVMCHLTKDNLVKPMIPINIIDFKECLINTLTINKKRRTNKEYLLISFMGVGDPLLNLKLIKDLYLIQNELINILGYKSIGYAISTMMPNNNIMLLTKMVNKLNIPLKVHFSMHNPIDKKRFALIPNSKINVNTSLKLLANYQKIISNNKIVMAKFKYFHRTKEVVEIHYTLIKDINDTNLELNTLISLLKKYNITIKFITFNPKDKLSISNNLNKWASCGEFTKHYYHKEIETNKEYLEFLNWKKKYEIKEY